MEIQKVKEARDSLAKTIAKLIMDFEWDTDTVIGGPIIISRDQDELHPRRVTVTLQIIVPE
ncbi:MAG: hypothetical protein P8168_08015 [Deltaproteobacteria bacterium]